MHSNLACAEVDHIALTKALSSTSLVADNDLKTLGTSKASRPTILSQDERDDIMYLATVIEDFSSKVQKQQISLVTRTEIELIYSYVIVPALQLCISPAYVIHLLQLYLDHKGTDRRGAGHYWSKPIIPFIGRRMHPQLWIARCILSDEFLVKRIAPNEQTRLLLGNAVAKFGEKHWTDRDRIQPMGGMWCTSDALTLAKLVTQKATLLS